MAAAISWIQLVECYLLLSFGEFRSSFVRTWGQSTIYTYPLYPVDGKELEEGVRRFILRLYNLYSLSLVLRLLIRRT